MTAALAAAPASAEVTQQFCKPAKDILKTFDSLQIQEKTVARGTLSDGTLVIVVAKKDLSKFTILFVDKNGMSCNFRFRPDLIPGLEWDPGSAWDLTS